MRISKSISKTVSHSLDITLKFSDLLVILSAVLLPIKIAGFFCSFSTTLFDF